MNNTDTVLEQVRIVINAPAWLVCAIVLLFAVSIILELRSVYWERRRRKARAEKDQEAFDETLRHQTPEDPDA